MKFDTEFEWIPTPTPQQYADARAFLEKHAADLVEVVLGGES
jgi:hypothetical protein